MLLDAAESRRPLHALLGNPTERKNHRLKRDKITRRNKIIAHDSSFDNRLPSVGDSPILEGKL